jgi:hypothetical protein
VDQVQLQELQAVSHNSVREQSCIGKLLNDHFILNNALEASLDTLKERLAFHIMQGK